LAVLQIVIVVLLYPFLRKFGFIKMFVVSFCVTFTTVYLPAIYLKETPENLYILLIQRFLIVICLLIPFEILDSKTDEKQLKTLPQLFGIPATKIFGIILLILFLVLSFMGFRKEKMVIDVIISVATGLFIAFSNINRNRYYTAFWVESMPVFWLLIYLLIYQF
jgi:4-hydroxybenzoate polyprenyltransferase